MADEIASHTLRLLTQIRDAQGETLARLDKLKGRFDSLEGRFDSLEGRFDSFERTTNERFETLERLTTLGFTKMSDRIDNLRDVVGERFRDHEARISALEDGAEPPSA